MAHNAAFDIGVLADTCAAIGHPVPDLRFACTLVVARRAWTGLLSYKLPVLADALGIELPRHHDAGDDARAAAHVMLAALKRRERPRSTASSPSTRSGWAPTAVVSARDVRTGVVRRASRFRTPIPTQTRTTRSTGSLSASPDHCPA